MHTLRTRFKRRREPSFDMSAHGVVTGLPYTQ